MTDEILPNISLELPDTGSDIGTWGAIVNADLRLVDAHDHTSGKGVRIVTSALNINADLSFGGFAALDVGKIDFSPVAALAAGAVTLFVNSADNELYWRSNGGTNVKLTSGTSLNTSLVGGIVGDYTSVSAEVAYDDSLDRYTFKQQGTPKTWAKLACGDVQIFETGTNESVSVRLKCPAALAASFDITLPLALPASTQLWQITSAGVTTFDNTIVNDVAMAAGKHVTVSSTGRFKHGDLIKTFHAYDINSTGTITKTSGVTSLQSSGTNYYLALPGFDVGQQIKSFAIDVFGNGTDDLTISFVKTNLGTETVINSTTHNNQAASWSAITFDVTDTTVASGDSFALQFSSNGTAQRVGSVNATYDRP